jgi:hypothetical protein
MLVLSSYICNMALLDWLKSVFSRNSSKSDRGMDKGEDPDVWARIKHPEAGLPEKSSSEMEEDMNVPKRPIGERAVDFVEGTVEEVKEQGTRLWNELSEQARQVDEATKPLRDKLAQKADEVVDRVDDFIDKTLEKAKDLERKEAEDNTDKDGDGIADTLPDFGKKLGEKHSDFFDKAEKWLDQQEGSRGDSGHAPDPGSTSGRKIEPLELPKDPAEDSPA